VQVKPRDAATSAVSRFFDVKAEKKQVAVDAGSPEGNEKKK
jgi:hypothetical protein